MIWRVRVGRVHRPLSLVQQPFIFMYVHSDDMAFRCEKNSTTTETNKRQRYTTQSQKKKTNDGHHGTVWVFYVNGRCRLFKNTTLMTGRGIRSFLWMIEACSPIAYNFSTQAAICFAVSVLSGSCQSIVRKSCVASGTSSYTNLSPMAEARRVFNVR